MPLLRPEHRAGLWIRALIRLYLRLREDAAMRHYLQGKLGAPELLGGISELLMGDDPKDATGDPLTSGTERA